MGHVADVEDADTAQALFADWIRYTLDAAVDAAGQSLARNEQQILVDGHVALRRWTDIRHHQHRLERLRDIEHLKAVVVALNRVLAGKREVGVRHTEEFRGWRRRGNQAHIPGSLRRIPTSGRKSDARVRARCRIRYGGLDWWRHDARRWDRRRRRSPATSPPSTAWRWRPSRRPPAGPQKATPQRGGVAGAVDVAAGVLGGGVATVAGGGAAAGAGVGDVLGAHATAAASASVSDTSRCLAIFIG